MIRDNSLHFAPHFYGPNAKPWMQRYSLTNAHGEVYWSGNDVPADVDNHIRGQETRRSEPAQAVD
jgi:hypothetical protein